MAGVRDVAPVQSTAALAEDLTLVPSTHAFGGGGRASQPPGNSVMTFGNGKPQTSGSTEV